MSTWPSTLPAPLMSGYRITPQPQTVRTEMETGLARVRRRSAVRLDEIEVSFTLTEAQMSTFRDWYDDSSTGISGGASWFTITLKSGDGTVTANARFREDYTADFQGRGLWRVSAKFEVRYA